MYHIVGYHLMYTDSNTWVVMIILHTCVIIQRLSQPFGFNPVTMILLLVILGSNNTKTELTQIPSIVIYPKQWSGHCGIDGWYYLYYWKSYNYGDVAAVTVVWIKELKIRKWNNKGHHCKFTHLLCIIVIVTDSIQF